MGRLAATGLLVVVALALPAQALGKETTDDASITKAKKEVAKARSLVDRSVDEAASGDRKGAYKLAMSAYLDHFELAEIPLRLLDANLVLDAEYSFAEFRNGIEAGDSQRQIESNASRVKDDLNNVERVLAKPGVAAPLMAAGFSFSIIFREGLEAVLMLAILLGTLEAGRAAGYRRPLVWGIAAALVATAATWFIASVVIDIAPVDRELLAGIMGALAVAVLFAVTFWLVSRFDQRRWMEFMKARVSSAIATGSAVAFAGLGFTAVYREGFETVLFYQTLLIFAKGLVPWVIAGLIAGIAVLAGIGWAILRLGQRLPVKAFLMASATIILLLSITFAGNTVSALQDAGVIQITPVNSSIFRLPVYLTDLTGIHATVEGLATQAALALVYLIGAIYLFVWIPSRRRQTLEART